MEGLPSMPVEKSNAPTASAYPRRQNTLARQVQEESTNLCALQC